MKQNANAHTKDKLNILSLEYLPKEKNPSNISIFPK